MQGNDHNMNDTKNCTKCNIVKHLSEFNLDNKNKTDKKSCYCKICNREANKEWHLNPYNLAKRKIKWLENRRKYIANNVWVQIALKVRLANRYIVKNINSVSDQHVEKWLGISREGFKEHMKNLFQPGMTWENHGKWHLDHVKALSKFKKQRTDEKLV